MGRLSILTALDLNDNSLTGSIPAELGNLTNLAALGLSGNGLTGSIPPELGRLSNLEGLYLSDNGLTGSIPPELGRLSNLEGLYLSDNGLTGSIPPELGNLTNLTHLALSGNGLTGSIPPELGRLSNLTHLWLNGNGLTGSIPWAELDNLTNLTVLRLDCNGLTGSIPAQLISVICDSFSDDDGSVHEANIERIALWGITTGCGPHRFCPSRTVTRAQMAAFLHRAAVHLYGAPAPAGEVRLSDVADDAWYRPYARWAVGNGVIRAPGGNFEPGGAVTRADMAEMLVAAFAHLSAPDRAEGRFTDTAGLTDGAVRAVEGIAAAEVSTGCAAAPRRYCPDKTVTRAQMASFLARAVQSAP